MPTVSSLTGIITLISALWWALLALGNGKGGVYFESPLWMGLYRALPLVCFGLAGLLTFVYVRNGSRNLAIFCCGLTAGLLPLVALLSRF